MPLTVAELRGTGYRCGGRRGVRSRGNGTDRMQVAPSLLDAPGSSAFTAATDWMTGTLLGSVAVSLCVLAIAFVGLMLMAGRLAVRDGLRVVIGCFVLLGAPAIAAGLSGAASEAYSAQPDPLVVPTLEAAPVTPPPDDSYAGASMRRD